MFNFLATLINFVIVLALAPINLVEKLTGSFRWMDAIDDALWAMCNGAVKLDAKLRSALEYRHDEYLGAN